MRSNLRILGVAIATITVLAPNLALAHPGHGQVVDFFHGVGHPLSGPDHMLAMVTIGLIAASLGGRALWAVPASFVAAMLVGGLIAINGVSVPFVELGIAASVLVLGLVTAIAWNGPVVAMMALAGIFALFHGYAHGAEMPADAAGATYAAGFILATSLLHLAGIGLGLAAKRMSEGPKAIRIAGLAVALTGAGLVVMQAAAA